MLMLQGMKECSAVLIALLEDWQGYVPLWFGVGWVGKLSLCRVSQHRSVLHLPEKMFSVCENNNVSVTVNWERQHRVVRSGNLQAQSHQWGGRPKETGSLETKEQEFRHGQSRTEQECCLVGSPALMLSDGSGACLIQASTNPFFTLPGQKHGRERFPRVVESLCLDHPWAGRLQSAQSMLVAAQSLCHL